MRKYNYPWHNDDCKRSQEYTNPDGAKRFFCETHNQWAAEMPTKLEMTFTYGDGTTLHKTIEYK